MTREQFIEVFKRDPSEVEEKWLRCIVPTEIKGKQTPICWAFARVPAYLSATPIPEEPQEQVYGKIIPDLTIEQFALITRLMDDDTFVFSFSADYTLAGCRSRWTSAEDCDQWLGFVNAVLVAHELPELTVETVITLAEYKEL